MIRPCTAQDLDAMEAIINAAARKYRGAIPDDCWHEPYMPREELEHEIASGVRFWGYCDSRAGGPCHPGENGPRHPGESRPRHPGESRPRHPGEGRDPISPLIGVMGLQDVLDATLIRHAYVLPECQGQGVGSALMRELLPQADATLLVGTWAAAHWAIAFYERHGFRLVTRDEKDRLLDRYWRITPRQRETSVVLAHGRIE